MTDEKTERITRDVRQLSAAMGRLEAVLAEPEASSKSWQDTADAFEYAMDLFWKVAKEVLASRGVEVHMPREAVQAACERGWLDNTGIWLQMLKDEYELSGSNLRHLVMRQLYPRIRSYYPEMQRLQERISNHFDEL